MTDTPVEALELCPHCEAQRSEPKTCQDGGFVYVVCVNCHSRGPSVSTSHPNVVGEAIAAWNRRALSTPPQAPGVVKPLEWREDGNGGFSGMNPFGLSYRVWLDELVGRWRTNANGGVFDSADAPKAACQADYERRILSTLVSAPPVSAGELVAVCDCCEKPITFDLLVPDDLWAQIAPKPVEGWKGGGLLCPDCILSRALTAANADRDRLRKDYNTARVYGDEQSARSHQQRERAEAAEADRDKWKLRAEQFQRARAELADMLNGTPCAEIRWQQEKEALEADRDRLARELEEAREAQELLREAIEKAQNALAAYIVPESGISDAECINHLLGILDSGELVRFLRSLTPTGGGEAEPFRTGQGWEDLSCDDQFKLATQIAANVGYVLTPEPEIQP